MIEMDLYDYECSDLVYDYVQEHWEDFLQEMIDTTDMSMCEYCQIHFQDFRDWCERLGYEISVDGDFDYPGDLPSN